MILHKIAIDRLEPYEASHRNLATPDWTLLDWNECSYSPSPLVLERLQKYLLNQHLNKYPDIMQTDLKKAIANYCGVEHTFVEPYAGSDAALADIFTAFVRDDVYVCSFFPTYSQIDTYIKLHTDLYTQIPIIEPLNRHIYPLSHNAKQLLCKYGSSQYVNNDVIYICNPNNPTGKLLDVNIIEQEVNSHPNKLFIIDEAYYEFAKQTCVPLVEKYKNILVIRTFSKAFGLAGIRLGYVIGHPDLLIYLRKIKNTKSVNQMAQIAGIAALEDIQYTNDIVDLIIESRNRFVKIINKKSKCTAIPSEGNFVLLHVPDVDLFREVMDENKILVRDRSHIHNLENCFRVTIGDYKQMFNITKIIIGI